MKKSIFIFRRDFRIIDNIGFINCYKNSDIIIPIFIFTPEQITNNKYKSNNAVQFMCESLLDLNKQLKYKLNLFHGNYLHIIKHFKKYKITDIYTNTDYSPYAIKRDKQIYKLCKQININFNIFHDICLISPGNIKNKQNNYYQKFTPFYNQYLKLDIAKPTKIKINFNKIEKLNIKKININSFYKINKLININGGRLIALTYLKKLKNFKNYDLIKNKLNLETTHLSAYLKFGCISIREVYSFLLKQFNKKHGIIRQLIWRDFYYHLGYGFTKRFGKSLKPKYDKIVWNNDTTTFNLWKNGKTGYPIIDAAMNQLNITGYMHNRSRLLVASFLIKNLQINWRWGEKYFAQKLIDYDVLVNQGNWQWVAGSGADSQPYFRIFNPWIQSSKYDKDCFYIKKWIPELNEINKNTHIHEWYKYNNDYNIYYNPIIDYKDSKVKTLKLYKSIFI